MSGLARAIAALARWVALGAAALGGVATLLCLALICWSVAARYLLGQPQPWIDKAAGWLVVALVMLAAPEAQRRFEHIGVDVLTGRLKGRAAHGARLLSTLSVALVAGILLQAGLETVEFSRMIGVMTEIEGVPVWWIQALLPLGAALLMLVALAQSLQLALGQAPDYLPDGSEELPRDTLARGE
ncbi:TRAP transporter small permease [Pseudoroseomonas cervicalis]|uniref:TRAP transporter small permease n=1 Tax=Teichococcus cervicalis TaxID=204525 RepID=UPI002780B4D0|nr:TRAP transporter small permease [Pseudoroseomonas cervicalis]MDQ1080395.1 TRAP-type C4-dicarboxylate transport system permease small subunit [Pseudoroseomonas cervicalis]